MESSVAPTLSDPTSNRVSHACPPLHGAVGVPPIGLCPSSRAPFGMCVVCHGPSAAGTKRCWSCRELISQLTSVASLLVLPTFMFETGNAAHRSLVGYKAAPTAHVRAMRQEALANWLGEWLSRHLTCLTAGEPVLLVPVPSSLGGRQSWGGVHPLKRLCEAAIAGRATPAMFVTNVLRLGDHPPSRLSASAAGYFSVAKDLRGVRVVVVDDVFASGARMLSAAAALSHAGADVLGGIPLGRLVRPNHNSATAAYWATFGGTAAGLDCCAICSAARQRR